MIRFVETSKVFPGSGSPALDGISAEVKPGRITGLVGSDGAGKTTALRLVAGLLTPSSGRIEVFGFDATRRTSDVRAIMGYMPQKFGLYEDLTVIENLNLYAKLRNLPRAQRRAQFDKLLEITDLGRFQKRLARRLSGGMKQKLGLACALVTTPKLLLLDEPGVGVDPLSRRELWKTVRELTTSETVVLWSTSYLDEAELCDETLLFNNGKLLFAGAPRELSERVRGRVFRVRGYDPARKRAEFARLSEEPEVVDVLIQGDALRVSFRSPLSASEVESRYFHGLAVAAATPCFEDGFVDALVGKSEKKASEPIRATPPVKAQAPSQTRTRRVAKSDEVVVEARKMTKRFGSFTAASEIEFSIRRGEIFGLLGPNGAGKSTSFKMLCGLLKPTSGDGFVAGVSLRNSSGEARKRLGYMAQKFSLYGNLSVRSNLDFYGGVYGLSPRDRREKIDQALVEYDLLRYADERAELLPLGYKQRLALASATLHSPEALFLDEPTSGVDPVARREFWRRVVAFAAQGVAILVTTHFMDEAEYCDQIALIMDGRKIAQGSPDAIKASAKTRDLDSPTLEDAFVRLIQRERSRSR